ncbi:TetR/AcrR family transcriptional regulator [Streptomyces sp. NPDC006355]|uniref:TetR/AcrR family transcriptional regulator n=1 Tax=Streptomyces sp. NPDC006355 TaxID=3156758 RepID=UPI0033A9F172
MRRRRAGGERRNEVLKTAIRVLAEHGYDRTRFSDVAEAAGVAVSTLQFYFGSRDDMLIEALHQATEEEARSLEEAAAVASTPWERITHLIKRGLAPLPKETWHMLLEFWYVASRDPELQKQSIILQRRYRQPFIDAIKEGIELGHFATDEDPEDLATVILALLDGMLIPRVCEHPYFNDERVQSVALGSTASLLGIKEAATQ